MSHIIKYNVYVQVIGQIKLCV